MRKGIRRAGCLAVFAVGLHAAGAGALVSVGDLRLPGQARALAISEEIAWVVTLDPRIDPNQPLPFPCPCPGASLRGFRVSDLRQPEELGVLAGRGDPRAVEVTGGIAYVAESAGLVLIDVSDPTRPVELARVTSIGRAYDVAVAGPFAYVGGWTGLSVIDVSDPRSPLVVGALEQPASLVEVRDGFAYLVGSDGSAGRLGVVDVSDPAAPALVGSLDTGAAPTAMAVDGDVWIAEDVGSFFIDLSLLRGIDVSDPANPIEVGIFEEPSRILDVESAGAYAYLAGSRGVRAVDVSDAASPVGRGALATPNDAMNLEVVAGLAYVVAGSSLQVLDLSEPDFPAEIGSIELEQRTIQDLAIFGDLVLVAENTFSAPFLLRGGSLTVIDASDPTAPREVGRVGLPGLAQEVEGVGARAYVTGLRSEVRVFDVSDPTAPVEIGTIDAPEVAFGFSAFEVLGGRIHLAWLDFFQGPGFIGLSFSGGFRAIDPAARASRGKGATPDLAASATGLEVVGDLAYLADGSVGLRVIDVSRPSMPVQRGSLALPGASDVAVERGLAYVTSNAPASRFAPAMGSLHSVDVSKATAPRALGSLELTWVAREIQVADGIAHLVTAPSFILNGRPRFVSLRAIDVSDPAHPHELGALPLSAATSLELVNGFVYVADGSTLRILDFGPEYRRPVSPVAIDVKPGDARNAIDASGRGSVRVAILGGEGLDVRTVDRRSLAFGPGDAPAAGSGAFKDVDRDGAADLVARFLKRHSGLGLGDSEACLRGKLLDGTRFAGCDAVRTPPPR